MSAGEAAVFLLIVGCLATVSASSKPVHITLTSKWSRTPILLEASEFLAAEDPLLFWKFLKRTEDIHLAANERDVYDAIMDHGEQLLPPLVFNCLQLSLSLHSQSPAVAMYQQLAEERRSSMGGECGIPWVECGGNAFCSVEDLTSHLQEEATPTSEAEVYSFDHTYPTDSPTSNTSSLPVVILYCQWGTESCLDWHTQLVTLTTQSNIRYIFRHHFKVEEVRGHVLSGYGVQLAVKNSEYKAVDDTKVKGETEVEKEEEEVDMDIQGFSFPTLKSLHQDLSEKLDEFRQHLQHNTREIPDLKAWQIQDLGLQAAQLVASSSPDMALSTLRDLVQNLPTMTRTLTKLAVKKDLKGEVTANQRALQQYGMQPGDSVIFFNGIILQTDSSDAFSVMDVLLGESHLIGGLTGLGLSVSDSHTVMQIPVHSQVQSFAVDMRSPSVVFINDLESDKIYARWSKSLKQFLQPTYPGALRQVAKNVFNLVFCFDPASIEGLEVVEYMSLFLDNLVPVRVGVLLVSPDDNKVGVVLSRGFYYIAENYSPRKALSWLLEVQANMTVEGAAVLMETMYPDAPDDVLSEQSPCDEQRKESVTFFEAKGLRSLPQVLLNGVQLNIQEEDLEAAIVNQLQQQTYQIQKWIYMKKITDSTDIYDHFMKQPNVLQRLNHHITATDSLQLDLSASLPDPIPDLSQFHSLGSKSMSALLAHHITYYTGPKDEFAVRGVSLWVVVDVESEQGKQAAISALSYLAESTETQIGFLHNPSSSGTTSDLARTIVAAELRGWSSLSLLLSLLSSSGPPVDLLKQQVGKSETVIAEAVKSAEVDHILTAHDDYCRRVLKLTAGQTAILANGKLVGPLESGESFTEQDYSMLVSLENSSHANAISEVVVGVAVGGVSPDDDTSAFRSRLVLKIASLLRNQPKQRRIPLPSLKGKHSGVHLPAPDPVHHVITAVLNPLDPTVQKWAHLLKVLQVVTPCEISIYLNPQSKLSEVPIKSFYRYVLEPELSFSSDGSLALSPRAIFSQLPHSPLLTLHMDVPHAWLVASVHSPHDLDNIHLQSVESGVQAEFLLEHILVEGQLYDASSNQPVPGLELVLGPPSNPNLYDTVVMANLGYFQLKASPGAWQLQIREGRSRTIYTIAGHAGDGLWDKEEERVSVTVRSFSGEVHIVKVSKKFGMEGERLLYGDTEKESETESTGSMWETLSSFMGGGSSEDDGKDKHLGQNETINVFSIASGHLYERFLRIMMLSVLKHTKHPVKFWFLENYLSPTFKDFIPHMAQHYGFEYALVKYKWPRWLHQQTEKQRLIWGYKILFLDVLFPLSVKHIIFVDADQTVRADLAELLEVPLDGAPYGYTPFCNDRPDMDGFRFWERGYWKSHLGNRRYHISALYVVDLLRFRQLAAGDRLRGQYQALSQDPNSLSNLDQDLPNNMIHQVPIKSLPQEWLWCETWCSEASKVAAKTIDLCNNPLTKEPKLTSAMRILPEWSGYDQEIRELQEQREALLSSTHPSQHKHTEL